MKLTEAAVLLGVDIDTAPMESLIKVHKFIGEVGSLDEGDYKILNTLSEGPLWAVGVYKDNRLLERLEVLDLIASVAMADGQEFWTLTPYGLHLVKRDKEVDNNPQPQDDAQKTIELEERGALIQALFKNFMLYKKQDRICVASLTNGTFNPDYVQRVTEAYTEFLDALDKVGRKLDLINTAR